MQTDVVILGGGAAGLFCAGVAARRGRSVVVIEHGAAPGEKIRISGGGRCNFTNLAATDGSRFLSRNARFALSALSRFRPQDFVSMVDAAGIAWHEKSLGQLFCNGPAMQIVDMLRRGLEKAGAQLWLDTSFGSIANANQKFVVETSRGILQAERVVVATGGKSIPKMGATPAGYHVAERFGIPLVETRPALVPLTFATQELEWMAPLAGVSFAGRIGVGRQHFDDGILFTHRGLSGPAVLQVSSYWREGQAVVVDLARGTDVEKRLREARAVGGRAGSASVLAEFMPERLARHLAGRSGPIATLSGAAIAELAARVHRMELRPVGTEGYRTAEVTLGGVDTAALDPRTMAARAVPGLHFIGEVVDVTGWLGGYNFQWAWASAHAAGMAV